MAEFTSNLLGLARTTVAERFGLTLPVEAMTLGTKHSFHMQSVNISRSGALLKSESSAAPIPFQNRTLIELVIHPDDKILFGKIRATAKVVRHEPADGIEKALFGIHLLDIEDVEEWEALMARFEASRFTAA